MVRQQPTPSPRRRPRRALLGLAALAFAAACGGAASGSSGVASLGSTTTTQASGGNSSTGAQGKVSADNALKFSQCMRSHGLPNFPDPTVSGGRASIQINGGPGSGLDRNSPQFQSAQTACRHLLPNGGQPSPQQQAKAKDDALHFAQCMRAHGINIPDPQVSTNGGLRIEIGAGQGLDPNSPQFQAAQSACQHFLPFNRSGGGITKQGPGPSTATPGGSQ